MSIVSRISKFFGREEHSVTFDEAQVTHIKSDGVREVIRWDDLVSVSTLTTGAGPWGEDVFFMLEGSVGGCTVSQETKGSGPLLSRLQQLPGFDNEVFINAMGSADDARFVCWQRDAL